MLSCDSSCLNIPKTLSVTLEVSLSIYPTSSRIKGHQRGLIIRNCAVLSIFFLSYDFFSLKDLNFSCVFFITAAGVAPWGGDKK